MSNLIEIDPVVPDFSTYIYYFTITSLWRWTQSWFEQTEIPFTQVIWLSSGSGEEDANVKSLQ